MIIVSGKLCTIGVVEKHDDVASEYGRMRYKISNFGLHGIFNEALMRGFDFNSGSCGADNFNKSDHAVI